MYISFALEQINDGKGEIDEYYPTPRIALFVLPSFRHEICRISYSQSIVYSQCTMRVSFGLSARRVQRTSQEALELEVGARRAPKLLVL